MLKQSVCSKKLVYDEGFSVSVITEEGNLFALMCLALKDSIENPNSKFRINVLAVAEAVFDDAHAQNPLEYAYKNVDPAADPNFYMQAYQHPDAYGEVHGFANGYIDAYKVAELIDAAEVELDT